MYHQSIKRNKTGERACMNDGHLLEVSLASSDMERVPATVVSVVAAPGAAHAERPAHQHHGILGGSSGSRTGGGSPASDPKQRSNEANGAESSGDRSRRRKRPGWWRNRGNKRKQSEIGIGEEGSEETTSGCSCPCRREQRDSSRVRARGGSCGASARKTKTAASMSGTGRKP